MTISPPLYRKIYGIILVISIFKKWRKRGSRRVGSENPQHLRRVIPN